MRNFRFFLFGVIFISFVVLNTLPTFSQEEPPEDDDVPVAGSDDCQQGDTCQAEIDDGQGGSFTVKGTVNYGEDGYIYITTGDGSTFIIGQAQGNNTDPGGGSTGGNTGGGAPPPPPPPPPPNDPPPCAGTGADCPSEGGGGAGTCGGSCFSNGDCATGYYCSGFTGTCRRTACPESATCNCQSTGTAACNAACSGGQECTTGYCFISICRSSACPLDASCTCGGTNTPTIPTVGPGTNTHTPTPGPGTSTPTAVPATPSPQPCTVNTSASPATVNSGQTSTISWTSAGTVGTCTISGPNFQTTGPTNGSVGTAALTPYTNTYYVTCRDSSNEVCWDNVTVNVNQPVACNTSCRFDNNCPAGLNCINNLCRNAACNTETDCTCGPGTSTPIPATPTTAPGCNAYCRFANDCTPTNPNHVCFANTCRNSACTSDTDCTCGSPPTPPSTNTNAPTGPGGGTTQIITGGVIYADNGNNNCGTGALPVANAQIQVINDADGSIVATRVSNASGQYSSITTTGIDYAYCVLTNIGTQTVRGVRDGGTDFTGTYVNGVGYGFDWEATPTRTIDFCIGVGSTSWYQTSVGDVRYNTVENPVADTKTASNSNPASNFFSSRGTNTIPTNRLSTPNWQVNREYTEYNPVSSLGSTSYSFYINQTTRAGVTPQTVGDTLPATLTAGASSAQGFYHKEGNLTINQNITVPLGNTVILLVNGDIDIRNPITVAHGSTLIIAAKGNITIQPTLGVAITTEYDPLVPSSAPLQGIYTAEGSITLESTTTCPTPSSRLNVSGSLIANSLRPFATNGGGKVINERSLCLDNRNFPSLKVYHRASFATNLSNILKSQSRRWNEGN